MLPRAAKHLERAKQLVNNWVLLPTFGPRKENQNLGSRPSSASWRDGVALLQEKDLAKTHVQMCPLALLHRRSHGHVQCPCFASLRFRDGAELVHVCQLPEALLYTALGCHQQKFMLE